LQSLGCRYAQGYYFSRPVRAERLLDALESNREHESRPVTQDSVRETAILAS